MGQQLTTNSTKVGQKEKEIIFGVKKRPCVATCQIVGLRNLTWGISLPP
jgi:hypothetical protein